MVIRPTHAANQTYAALDAMMQEELRAEVAKIASDPAEHLARLPSALVGDDVYGYRYRSVHADTIVTLLFTNLEHETATLVAIGLVPSGDDAAG